MTKKLALAASRVRLRQCELTFFSQVPRVLANFFPVATLPLLFMLIVQGQLGLDEMRRRIVSWASRYLTALLTRPPASDEAEALQDLGTGLTQAKSPRLDSYSEVPHPIWSPNPQLASRKRPIAASRERRRFAKRQPLPEGGRLKHPRLAPQSERRLWIWQ